MAGRDKTVAVLALLTGALVWGLIWYPFRVLELAGLSGLYASVLSYAIAAASGVVLLRAQLRGFSRQISGKLVLIGLAAGGCNLGYVLATLHGEVMRVLLLFYLAPLWTVVWSRILLDERLNRAGIAVVMLSLSGAITMLWRPELGAPWPSCGAEWLGMGAGFLFALSNVLVRQTHQLSIALKSMAVFLGVVLLGLLVMLFELVSGSGKPVMTGMTQMHWWHWGLLVLVGVILLFINLVVQHGLSTTPANQAIVIFLFELVVAALSSWLLTDESMGVKEWVGGAMIITASLFSGHMENRVERG